jgi:hypothetical protein
VIRGAGLREVHFDESRCTLIYPIVRRILESGADEHCEVRRDCRCWLPHSPAQERGAEALSPGAGDGTR